jgi:hypothetical protein
MIQLMVAAITDHTGRPDLWRRYLRLLLDGMRAQAGARTELPVLQFGDDELRELFDQRSPQDGGDR